MADFIPGDKLKKAMKGGSTTFRGMGRGGMTADEFAKAKDARQATETSSDTQSAMDALAKTASDSTPVAPQPKKKKSPF